jgi:hypothetical protein
MSALFKPPNASDGPDRAPPLSADQLKQLGSKYSPNGASADSWRNAQSTADLPTYSPLKQPPNGSEDAQADRTGASSTTLKYTLLPASTEKELSGTGAFEAAADRTRQSVKPDDGRRISRATTVPEALTSALVVGTANRAANAAMIGPRLLGDVMEGRLDPNSPEAIQRSADTALNFVGGGVFGAERNVLGVAGGRPPPQFPGLARPRNVAPATFGKAASSDYRTTFMKAYPELDGKVRVHHAVPQHAFDRYPNVFTKEELHSLENLRGIPNEMNGEVHLSQIAKEWKAFYSSHQVASKKDLLDFATEIDGRFGHLFTPAIREVS